MKILRHLTHNAGFIAQSTAPYLQVELSLTLTCSSVEKKNFKTMQRAATCSLVHVKFANTSSFSTIPGNGINVKIDKLASDLFLHSRETAHIT